MPRPIDNLESAFTEMYEFITDLPSGLDGFESDFDEAFKELENLKVAIAQPGKPLTLNQLREMDGQPVWVVCLKKEKYIDPPIGWRILEKSISGSFGVWNGENCLSQRSYGSDWLAYPYPPAHIDRSEWEGCRKCRSCWTCKSAIEPVRAENSKCFLCEDLSNYEPLNFCSHCGRPLTEEAWVELERRVKG